MSLIRNTDPPGEARKTEDSLYASRHSLESSVPRIPDLRVKLTRRFSLDPRPFLQEEFKFYGVCLEGTPRPLPNLSRIRSPGELRVACTLTPSRSRLGAPTLWSSALRRTPERTGRRRRQRGFETTSPGGRGELASQERPRRRRPGDPRRLGERAAGMGEPARRAG